MLKYSGGMRGAISILILTSLSLAAAGCSFPLSTGSNHELNEVLFGYHSFHQTEARTRRISTGVDFRTTPLLAGIAIGIDDTRVIGVQDPSAGQFPCEGGFVLPLGMRWPADGGDCRSLGWFHHSQPMPGGRADSPSFVHVIGAGVHVDWNATEAGFGVGLTSVSVLRADPEACGVFLLDYASRFPSEARLRRMKGVDGCN